MSTPTSPTVPSPSFNAAVELGSSGLRTANGTVFEEWLLPLRGLAGMRVFREMRDNDATVGAIVFAIEMLLRGVQWKIEAGSEDEADIEIKDFVESCRHDMSMSWSDLISEIVSMLVYGFAPFEITYKARQGRKSDGDSSKHDDGLIGWRKISLRAQDTIDRWEFDESGGIIGFWQLANFGSPEKAGRRIFIPMEKALLFRTTREKNSPVGRSMLRNAYRAWFFKKRFEEIEAIGVERGVAGFPVMRVPAKVMDPRSATPDEKAVFAAAKQLVSNIRADRESGVVLPSDRDPESKQFLYDLQLIATEGRRVVDTDTIINRYDSRIAMSVLADFVLLGQQGKGSYALSSDKTALFTEALKAWAMMVCDVFNRYAIPRLLNLNSMTPEKMPTLTYDGIGDPDLSTIASYVSTLSGAGAQLFPDLELENALRRRGKLPERDEEENPTLYDDINGGETTTFPEDQVPDAPDEPRKPVGKSADPAPVSVVVNNEAQDLPEVDIEKLIADVTAAQREQFDRLSAAVFEKLKTGEPVENKELIATLGALKSAIEAIPASVAAIPGATVNVHPAKAGRTETKVETDPNTGFVTKLINEEGDGE